MFNKLIVNTKYVFILLYNTEFQIDASKCKGTRRARHKRDKSIETLPHKLPSNRQGAA